MIKLSIIIPVYNIEKYIGRCIESCLKQDIPINEYELLIIDDGSQDDSMTIVRQYAHQYCNIRYIEQTNAGPSVARNRGILEAKGEYLWFIDGDDDIQENTLKRLSETAISKAVDILGFDINVIEKDKITITYPHHADKDKLVYDGLTFFHDVAMPPSACVALFRKAFLQANNLNFIEGISHEDYEFTPRVYCSAKKAAYIPLAAYNYWVRPDSRQTSISKESHIKKAKDLLIICDSLYAFMKQNIEENSDAYQVMVGKINFAFSQSLRNYTKEAFPITEYKGKSYYPLDISHEGNWRNQLKYRLINYCIPLYLFAHRLFKQ